MNDRLLYKVKGRGTFVVPSSRRQTLHCNTRSRQVVFLSLESALSEGAFRDSAVYEPIFRGLNSVLQEYGYNLLLAHVRMDWQPPACLINGDVSGVIFYGKAARHRKLMRLPKVRKSKIFIKTQLCFEREQ